MAALHATALDCHNMTGDFALMRLNWLCIVVAGSPVLGIQRPIVAYDDDAQKKRKHTSRTKGTQKQHKQEPKAFI